MKEQHGSLNPLFAGQKQNSFLKAAPLLMGLLMVGNPISVNAETNSQEISILQQQTITIKGQIKDAKGEALIGVNVMEEGTTNGTITDFDGNFQLKASSNATLKITYIGYKELKVAVKGQRNLSLVMQEDTETLEEVVVVGYGVTRKRDLAGSITSLKTDDIKAGVVTNTAQMLKGRAAGVQVRQNSGEPGGGISIRIRGASSVSSNNEPLYVIDGFQTDLGNQINPNDIESIEILKDAAATSIYGARGANGVVLITTKQGKAGKYSVSYTYNASMKSMDNPWKMMNAEQTIQNKMRLWEENGKNGSAPYTEAESQFRGEGFDYIDMVTRNALTQNHQLSITGGSDKMTMAVSADYIDDKGVLRNTGFDRFSGRFNMGYKLNDHVRFGTNVYLARSKKNYRNIGESYTMDNFMFSLFITEPMMGPDGVDVFGNKGKKVGLLDELYDATFENVTNNLYATIHGEVDFFKGLTGRVQYTYANNNTKDANYYPKTTNIGKGVDGQGTIKNWKNDNHQIDATLTYHNKFADIHNLKITAGTTYINNIEEYSGLEASGFSTDEFSFNNMGAGANINWVASNKGKATRTSFFGRLEYVLKDKYILNASFRADGASNFGPDNKWGYFPSGSLAWQIGEEKFMDPLKKVLTSMKLRASYGITGNDGIGSYLSSLKYGMSPVFLGGSGPIKGMYPTNPANPELKWESTSQLNIGLDFSLFNRIEVNLDYYNKVTKDLLNQVAVSSATGGFTTMMANNGKVRNRGFELFVKSHNFVGDNFTWTTNFNLSKNKNKVLELNKGEARYRTVRPQGAYLKEDFTILKEGLPMSSLYGYVFDGIVQKGETYAPQPTSVPGDPKFKDLDGDGIITQKDRTIIGDGNPDFIFGLGNDFTYKDFDFSFFLDASVGNDLLNLSRVVLEDKNRIEDSMDRWTLQHPSNSVPRNGYTKFDGVQYGSYINTRFVEKATYVRLQNIELGYTLPVNKFSNLKKYIKHFRVFVGAQNLFTITNYTGFSPEVSTKGGDAVGQGLDFSSYPAYRTFNFGAKITF